MSFDPFAEVDLADKLEAFHALDSNQRDEVARKQMKGLRDALGIESLNDKVRELSRMLTPPL